MISQIDEVSLDIYKDAIKLDSFAVNIRYPDIIIMPSKQDIEDSISIAERCKKFVYDRLQK